VAIWMQTTGATLLTVKRCSVAWVQSVAHDSYRTCGRLYLLLYDYRRGLVNHRPGGLLASYQLCPLTRTACVNPSHSPVLSQRRIARTVASLVDGRIQGVYGGCHGRALPGSAPAASARRPARGGTGPRAQRSRSHPVHTLRTQCPFAPRLRLLLASRPLVAALPVQWLYRVRFGRPFADFLMSAG
jgi:hypothetical protein